MTHNEQRRRQTLEQIAEVKRILSATEYALNHKTPATLLVTSGARGEGKSLFAAALAAAAAQSGRYRVAALDLNWYQPTLHRFFGLAQTHTTQQIGEADLRDLVCQSGEDSLDILTAPSDFADQSRRHGPALTSPARLIRQARDAYDLVVIDSAAVFPTNRIMLDPVMLAGIADGVVLVILTAATPRQQVRKAQKIMEAAGANILGAVANHWPPAAQG
ncbi:hypothetical protein THSYN_15985 [Candidatus Thiodictyon syntrophicum]|jgi:Mrp family chromosome partitioning ATPase|uniref:Uncharacterized protein n=1 Tax=Candidatus Thiodictyon syntrophicum TaxID=1166950 RepID=A0A2K8U9P2_9GAMM|nr:hypothetical protein THSYN_15985 [Candidatus Thiodictyon syntrophicum]